MADSAVAKRFISIVASCLHCDESAISEDTHLDTEAGAESLDLMEIMMEAEAAFNIWIPERNILDTASEIFGEGVLHRDGVLTDQGKQLLRARAPESDWHFFEGDITVKDVQRYLMRVGTWVNMIESLVRHSPKQCPKCSGPVTPERGFRMRCQNCSEEISLPSGDELNQQWVRTYYAGSRQ